MFRFRIFAICLAVLMLVSGCSQKPVVDKEPEVAVQPEPEPVVDPETLEIQEFMKKYIDSDERPIAVMVDNDDKNARPHAGLSDAYLIYEMVVEGRATRFMALFKGVDTPKIGPVRSSRHYFLDYVMENGAIYTHFGWSPKASSDISTFGIEKINGVLGGDGDIFWREEKFKGDWHSAYTSVKNIKDMAAKKGFSDVTERKNGIEYSDKYFDISSGSPAVDVSLKYSYGYTTGYIYNPEKKVYEKTILGAPHVMQSGETLEVKNIIVTYVSDVELGDGTDRRNILNTGSGKGYYITNGMCEEITWTKSDRKGNTIYKKADGTVLKINPGKTIVNLISPDSTVTIN